ncbi:DUF3299 domain-containing protein [Candidatus Sororendozoicomonas aggregata]|uniref:DUF3299 domain-containing protein n=1 Tax=Candidatus Sororendozoicomonas aggregata TaxID=3073239 RepID=UPI002ED2D722
MNALLKASVVSTILLLSAQASVRAENIQGNPETPSKSQQTTEPLSDVRELQWDDLAPPPEPAIVNQYNEGAMSRDEVIAYLDKLGLTTVSSMDNVTGKMPGYLVPLNMNEQQIATELLLVPTLGACIHVPPPPPNQIVYISYPKGIKVTEAGYTPYWVFGTLKIEKKTSEYTETLYTMAVDKIVEYEF